MSNLLPLALPVVAASIVLFYRRRFSLRDIKGPPCSSWLYGNVYEVMGAPSGELERKWQSEYGDIVHLQGPFGNDVLLIMDPKALNYIYQTSAERFYLDRERVILSDILVGNGLPVVDGEQHKRQRKIMLPGFTAAEVKSHLSVFSADASKLVDKWRRIIESNNDPAVINVNSDLARATLDAIGLVAFDYHFDALEESDNKLAQAYSDILFSMFGKPTPSDALSTAILRFIPTKLARLLVMNAPNPRLQRAQHAGRIADELVEEIFKEKRAQYEYDTTRKDVISLVLRAYASSNASTKLTDYEMVSQMKTMILAGSDTTSTSLTWTLWELSKHLNIQTELREEVSAMRASVGTEPSTKDLESMPLLNGVIMEGLRLHPSIGTIYRQAFVDDVIPLSTPLTLKSGKTIYELPIAKGTKMMTSIEGYNWHKDVWGSDAAEFNPRRWLEDDKDKGGSRLGMKGFTDTMSFGSGTRRCIGWRFAVLEMQSFLFQLIDNFEFLPTPQSDNIQRLVAVILTPIVEGEFEKGAQMPLWVRSVKD